MVPHDFSVSVEFCYCFIRKIKFLLISFSFNFPVLQNNFLFFDFSSTFAFGNVNYVMTLFGQKKHRITDEVKTLECHEVTLAKTPFLKKMFKVQKIV